MKRLYIAVIILSIFVLNASTVFAYNANTKSEINNYLSNVLAGEHGLFTNDRTTKTLAEEEFSQEEIEWLAKRGFTPQEALDYYNDNDTSEAEDQMIQTYDINSLIELNCTRDGSLLVDTVKQTGGSFLNTYNNLDDQFPLWIINGTSLDGNYAEITMSKTRDTGRLKTSAYSKSEKPQEVFLTDNDVVSIFEEHFTNNSKIIKEQKNISFGLGDFRTEWAAILTDSGEEFIIPIGNVNNLLGLKKGNIYTTTQAMEKIDENYEKHEYSSHEMANGLGGGGGASNNFSDKLPPLLISIIELIDGYNYSVTP